MRGWNRLLWGIEFRGSLKDDQPMLLGESWDREIATAMAQARPQAPTRALLFMSRREARAWCKWQRERYAGRSDCCAQWRFTPVRVREVVQRADAA